MPRPRIVIAGASGVVGRHLVAAARERFDVTVLTRQVSGSEPPGATPATWQPDAARRGHEEALSRLTSTLEGATALVNLAGSSLAAGRLGPAHMHRLLTSRVDSATTLVTALQRCRRPPEVMVQASATGYYGQRGDDELDEEAGPGEGFVLTPVASATEAAAAPAAARARLCVLRTGVVLARDAPAWQRLLLPIRLGFGGPLGSGAQWLPWIDADDLARAYLYVIDESSCDGAYNAVAPEAVRQRDLGRAAARRLRRPFWFPAPAWLLRLALGRLADGALLQSARVVPVRLSAQGFTYQWGTLERALDKLLSSREQARSAS